MGSNVRVTTNEEPGAMLTLWLPKSETLLDVYIHRQSNGKSFYGFDSWWNEGEGFSSNSFFRFLQAFFKWQHAAKRLEKALDTPKEAPVEEAPVVEKTSVVLSWNEDEEDEDDEFIF